jgi:hypothetical protein
LEVALGHTKIAHASPRTTQDMHNAEPRALRARPRLLETSSRLAQDSSRHTHDRAKSVQEPPTQPKTAEETSQTSPRQAMRALGAPEDSPRWARDTPKTSSSKGQEVLGLPGMAPPEWLGVDLDTLVRRKRITRELAWIKRITSELPWGLAPACTCQPVPSEVALGHTKIAHASPRTTQDRHNAEPRALRARPKTARDRLKTGSRQLKHTPMIGPRVSKSLQHSPRLLKKRARQAQDKP